MYMSFMYDSFVLSELSYGIADMHLTLSCSMLCIRNTVV